MNDSVPHPMNTMTLGNEEYFTPVDIWSPLQRVVRDINGRWGLACEKFDLDPCTAKDRPWDIAYENLSMNGLEADWEGRVWLNPPYGRKTGIWMKKLADHGCGTALIPARTDTQFFQEQVFAKATGILFLRGRIHFCDSTGKGYEHNSGAPSCLVAYGREDWDILQYSKLKGIRIKL